eukprot:6331861-Amphidinium_carterae.1
MGALACTMKACPEAPNGLANGEVRENVQEGCELSDGTHVPSGWAGSGAGDSYCNTCKCMGTALACTMKMCEKRQPPVSITCYQSSNTFRNYYIT